MLKTHVKRQILRGLKWIISLAILGYLCSGRNSRVFYVLQDHRKDWLLLALALGLLVIGLLGAMVRCYVLIRTMGIPLSLREALRLGFMGYLFNFLSAGVVGEDLFKAVFLARRHRRGRRIEALAVVLMDRMIGFYTLLLLAATGVLLSGTLQYSQPEIKYISRAALLSTLAGTVAFGLLFVPAMTSERVIHWVGRVPLAGGMLKSLLRAFATFRGRPWALLQAGVISIVTQTLYVVLFFTIACGLQVDHPTFGQHFAVVPLSLVTSLLPLPGGALGAFEYAFDFLYRTIGDSNGGLLVALGYRGLTIIVLAISVCLYATRSVEVDEALHEAEELEEASEEENMSVLDEAAVKLAADESSARSRQ